MRSSRARTGPAAGHPRTVFSANAVPAARCGPRRSSTISPASDVLCSWEDAAALSGLSRGRTGGSPSISGAAEQTLGGARARRRLSSMATISRSRPGLSSAGGPPGAPPPRCRGAPDDRGLGSCPRRPARSPRRSADVMLRDRGAPSASVSGPSRVRFHGPLDLGGGQHPPPRRPRPRGGGLLARSPPGRPRRGARRYGAAAGPITGASAAARAGNREAVRATPAPRAQPGRGRAPAASSAAGIGRLGRSSHAPESRARPGGGPSITPVG